MSTRPRYLLDSDSFIRSKREHYAFDFCPAYWEALLRGFSTNRIHSIQPIRRELLRGKDALANWVRDDVPEAFFSSVEDAGVEAAYRKVMNWAQNHEQYTQAAKQAFARSADPWLVAYAAAHGDQVVSYEVSKPDAKDTIQLPNVARQFHVQTMPPYVMLRQLKVVFRLAK